MAGTAKAVGAAVAQLVLAAVCVAGGWIAKDYPTYHDIGVDREWARWAETVIRENSSLL